MKKRIISLLAAAALMVSMIHVTAFAAQSDAEIGLESLTLETNTGTPAESSESVKEVSTKDELVKAFNDSTVSTVKLKNDISMGSNISENDRTLFLTVNRPITLDLNGKKLSGNKFFINRGYNPTETETRVLTVIDSGTGGEIHFSTLCGLYNVSFKLESGTIKCAPNLDGYDYTFIMTGGCIDGGSKQVFNLNRTLFANGGEIKSTYSGVSGAVHSGYGGTIQCGENVINPTVFNCTVYNDVGGKIEGGLFNGKVTNSASYVGYEPGQILGGVFYGPVENNGVIKGGMFYNAISGTGTIDGLTVTYMDGSSTYAKQVVQSGEKVTTPDTLTKEGYLFEGWYNGDTKYDFNTAVTEDGLILTAKWISASELDYPTTDNISGLEEISAVVLCTNVPSGQQSGKYYGLIDGGFTSTEPVFNQKGKAYESTLTLIPSAYCNQFSTDTKIRHNVLSSQTTDGLSFKVKYDPETKMWVPEESVKLMVIWVSCDKHEVPIYTVTFDGNGGNPSVESMKTVNMKLTELPTATYSNSFRFDGWYTAANGGTKVTTSYEFSGNTTIYAHWIYTGGSSSESSYFSTTYSIKVRNSVNGTVTANRKTSAAGSSITLTVEPDQGYTLETLTATKANGEEVNLAIAKVGEKYTFKMPSSNVTVKATFMEDNSILDADIVLNWSKTDAGKWKYGMANGYLTNGWNKIGATWYYFNADGTAKQSEWFKENGKWYYFKSSCGAAYGWCKIDGNWYYFNGNNSMRTGWLKDNGSWYYLDSNGKMVTGWKEINGSWYYFSKESGSYGKMASNTTVGGYKINADGVWVK